MICDGYTFEGRITDGQFTVRIRYRPMLTQERRQFVSAFRGWPIGDLLAPGCVWLSRHLLAISPDMTLSEMYFQDRLMFASVRSVLVGVAGPDGVDWTPRWEYDDVQNLRSGVHLDVLNPRLARRSCADCQKWWYDEDTGERLKISGIEIERPIEAGLPCQTEDGCAIGTPDRQKRLSPRNRAAYDHFRECEAVHSFPDDPIVRRNALVIRNAISSARREIDHGRRGTGLARHDLAGGRVVATNGRTTERALAGVGADRELFDPFGDIF